MMVLIGRFLTKALSSALVLVFITRASIGDQGAYQGVCGPKLFAKILANASKRATTPLFKFKAYSLGRRQVLKTSSASSKEGLVAISPGIDMKGGAITHAPSKWAIPLNREIADPTEYYFKDAMGKPVGVIHTGTGSKMMVNTNIEKLVKGEEPFLVAELPIFRKNKQGYLKSLSGDRMGWDLTLKDFPNAEGKNEIYGYSGVMTPTADVPDPRFSKTNHLREIHVLKEQDGKLVDLGPLMDRKINPENKWIGHAYGPKFYREDDGKLYIVYEKVTAQKRMLNGDQVPTETNLFRREMLSPTRVSPVEEKMLGVDTVPKAAARRGVAPQLPYPSTVRRDQGKLLEGIAVSDEKISIKGTVNGKTKTIEGHIGFWSGNDYDRDYGAFVGVVENGKIEPVMNAAMSDQYNLLEEITQKYRLRGAGRMTFVLDATGKAIVNSDGTYVVRFHAYLPDQNSRSILFAKIRFGIDSHGDLEATVLDELNDFGH